MNIKWNVNSRWGYQFFIWKTPYRCLRVKWCRKEIASCGIRTAAEKRRNGILDEVHRFYEGSSRISLGLLSLFHFVYLIPLFPASRISLLYRVYKKNQRTWSKRQKKSHASTLSRHRNLDSIIKNWLLFNQKVDWIYEIIFTIFMCFLQHNFITNIRMHIGSLVD